MGSSITPVRMSLLGAVAAVSSLAFVVYWTVNYPGQSGLPLIAALVASWLAASVCLGAMLSMSNKSPKSARTASGSATLASVVLGAYAVMLGYPHPKVQARLAQWGRGGGMVVPETDKRRVPTLGRH